VSASCREKDWANTHQEHGVDSSIRNQADLAAAGAEDKNRTAIAGRLTLSFSQLP